MENKFIREGNTLFFITKDNRKLTQVSVNISTSFEKLIKDALLDKKTVNIAFNDIEIYIDDSVTIKHKQITMIKPIEEFYKELFKEEYPKTSNDKVSNILKILYEDNPELFEKMKTYNENFPINDIIKSISTCYKNNDYTSILDIIKTD